MSAKRRADFSRDPLCRGIDILRGNFQMTRSLYTIYEMPVLCQPFSCAGTYGNFDDGSVHYIRRQPLSIMPTCRHK